LVGRSAEVGVLLSLAEDALRGRSGALLVSGEAGIGKTALVRHAEYLLGGKIAVRWIRCLPLTALATPLLPVCSALAGPLPDDGFAAMRAVDDWLTQRPTLLVVDDLQWADPATLDLLTYVLAGGPDRQLAVVVTVRSSQELPVVNWLAEARRLPGVAELTLQPLDRTATGEQLTAALGRIPHESLIDDVHLRTGGNPYLTRLLVRGVDPGTAVLPAGMPSELREALSARLSRLSAATRELITMVAVAGRPQRSPELVRAGYRPPVLPALREAVDSNVLVVGSQERYWFAHPLMAEMLREQLLPEERRALHVAFAVAADDPVAVADHYHLAELPEPAYRSALAAAAGARPETAMRLLRRAVDLAPAADAATDQVVLLRRLREAAAAAGRDGEEIIAVTELLDHLRPDRDRAEMVRILVRRSRLTTALGRRPGLDDAATAAGLTEAAPDQAERALALAELARVEYWHGGPGAAEHAREALAVAESWYASSPSPLVRSALAAALAGNVMVRLATDDVECRDQAMRALELAVASGDQWTMVHAAAWAANTIDVVATRESVELFRRARKRAADAGAPQSYLARYSAFEAGGLLDLGESRECAERIREVLSTRPTPFADLIGRLTASELACRQGRTDDARRHLARAEEIAGVASPSHPLDAARAELAVAAGDHERALAAVERGLALSVPPTQVERLLPLAAQALADRIQAIRDRGDEATAALARLADLRRRHPTIRTDIGGHARYRAVVRAMQAWYDAEAIRADGTDATSQWRLAADACAVAVLPWDEAYCRQRQAGASASAGKVDRAALRRAHELAVALGAEPLVVAAEELARVTRIRLGPEPATSRRQEEIIPGLTGRETDVLRLLMRGHTYAEIAARLVISEKTVGTHVSNMLRKTGTTNRVALCQLAGRLSASTHT
jgi:DNA-binding NarL/FixJ family response regulator